MTMAGTQLTALLTRKTPADAVLRYKLLSFLRDDRSVHEMSEARLAQYRRIDDYVVAHRQSTLGAVKSVGAVFFSRFYASSEFLAETASRNGKVPEPLDRLARDEDVRGGLQAQFKTAAERLLTAPGSSTHPTYATAVRLTLSNDSAAEALLEFEQRLFDTLGRADSDDPRDASQLHALYGFLNREALLRVAPDVAQDVRNLTETPLRLQNLFRTVPVHH